MPKRTRHEPRTQDGEWPTRRVGKRGMGGLLSLADFFTYVADH